VFEVKAVNSDNLEDLSPANSSFIIRRGFTAEPDESPFSISRNLQDELNNGIISEKMRQEFKNGRRTLSTDAFITVIAQYSEWLITDDDDRYRLKKSGSLIDIYERDPLFQLDPAFQAELDDGGVVSERLRKEFENEDIELAPGATVAVITQGVEWLVNGIYIVRKESNSLNVYLEEFLFNIELMQYIIANLNSGVVTDALRREFEDNGVRLSRETVSAVDQDDKWLINSDDKKYTVLKVGDSLDVYQSINDDPSEAIPLAVNTAVESLSQPDSDDADGVDIDWFRFTLPKQSEQPIAQQFTVFFRRVGAVGSTAVKVYRYPNFAQEIADFSVSDKGFFATGILPGDYLIKLEPVGEKNDSAYFLTVAVNNLSSQVAWDTEPNNVSGNASGGGLISLSRNTPWADIAGNKWTNGDGKDWFRVKIDVPLSVRLNVNVNNPQIGSIQVITYPAVFLSSAIGSFIVTPGSSPRWKLEAGVEAGEYLLEVDLSQYELLSSYFITLQIFDLPSGEIWEREPNEPFNLANPMFIGARMRGARGYAGDLKDWFRLNIPSDGILNLASSRILSIDAVNIYPSDPVLHKPVGDPLDYDVQLESSRDYTNLDISAGEYLIEADLNQIAGDYWLLPLLITSVDHDAPLEGILKTGEVLSVEAVWDPGNTVTFDVIDISTGEALNDDPITMYDNANDGVYVGAYIVGIYPKPVPAEEEEYLKEVKVIVHFRDRVGNTARIPIDDEITFDLTPPDTTPPEIRDVNHDAADGILRAGEKLTVTIEGDPENVATFYVGDVASGLVAYDDGRHGDGAADDGVYVGVYEAKVDDYQIEAIIIGYLADEAGNISSLEAVLPVDIVGLNPVILSVEHTGRLTLGRGDVLEVTLTGDPQGIASFQVEGLITDIPLYDDGNHNDGDRGDGVYVGAYEIVEGDEVISAPLTAYLIDREGRRTSKVSPVKVTVDAVAPAPVLEVQAYDRPDDQGGYITVSWKASTELDFAHYNIYLSDDPRFIPENPIQKISDITNPEKNILDVEVGKDLTDYFVAVTAVDIMGNESELDEDSGSIAGPVQAFDNLKPMPVRVVRAEDRDDDFGGVIILNWSEVNESRDFVKYNIYQDTKPITSVEDLTPVDSLFDRYVTGLNMSVEFDMVDYFFAVTAVDISGSESELDASGGSVAGPIQAVNNLEAPPAVPVIFLGAPVSTIRHNHVAFHWNRFAIDSSLYKGYYVRLDDANWQWQMESTAFYHDLREGQHTFSIRTGGQAGEQTTISRSFIVETVFIAEDEPNDSREDADSVRLGAVMRGAGSEDGDSDWFRVHTSTTEPGVLDILLSYPGAGSSTEVTIYSDQPFRKVGEMDVSDGQPAHFPLGVDKESDYFIHIGPMDNNSEYRLVATFEKLPSGFFWEVESNDTGTSANPLPVADSQLRTVEVRGDSAGNGDQDWFRVHVPDIEYENTLWMNIAFYRPDRNSTANVEIYSENPNIQSRQVGGFSLEPVGQEQDLPVKFSWIVEGGKDYFIKVDNGDEPTSSVYFFRIAMTEEVVEKTIVWEIEPNNLAAWANSLKLGVKSLGTNWDGDQDDDWYALGTDFPTLNAEERNSILSLNFSRPAGIGSTELTIYDSANQFIDSFTVDVNSGQMGSFNIEVKDNRYYIKVHPQDESPDAIYQLSAVLVEDIILSRISADGEEIERQGRPLRLGDVIQLSVAWDMEDGKAFFDVGDVAEGVELKADGENVYTGRYTIAEGNNEIAAPVILHLEDRIGSTADIELAETVAIDTTPPEIVEITHDGLKPLPAGKKLTVRMVGESRGRAKFHISDFRTGLDMYSMVSEEDEPELAILSWDWRPDPPFGVVVSGEVKNFSQTLKTRVKAIITFYDSDGEAVGESSAFTAPMNLSPGVVASFRMYPGYTGKESSARLRLVYGPDAKLAGESSDEEIYIGIYQVEEDDNIKDAPIIIYLTDSAGNRSSAQAQAAVTFDTIPPVIKSVSHDADKVLVEGDVLTVTLESEPDGEASFDIGDFRTDIEMEQTEPGSGIYVGTYRVKAGDSVENTLIVGKFRDAAGNEDTQITVKAVSINTAAPVITSVTHSAGVRPFIEDEILVVTANIIPGVKATFDVEGLTFDRPMYDDGQHDDGDADDGVYKGSYVIKRGDNVSDAEVIVEALSPNGKTVLREAFETVSVDTTPPPAVSGVMAVDKPDDEGCCVILSWNTSEARDLDHYNIYQSKQPIIRIDDMEPVYTNIEDAEASSFEIMLPPPEPGVPTPSFYFAVTAVDIATNESQVMRGSIAGPVLPVDNLPPLPVEVVSAYDRAYDNGKVITIEWSDPSLAEDFSHYHIYMDVRPILSIADLEPVEAGITDRNILSADISVPQDDVRFYFAVTAVDTSGNESMITDNSAAGPVISQDNLGIPPDTLVRIISGPVGEIRHDDVTFVWRRWYGGQFSEGESPGYFYKLDNGSWTWTDRIHVTFYDLREGEHTFYVRADLGSEGTDPLPAIRVFAVRRLLLSETEPNASAETANWIPRGMTVFGTNESDDDQDWYRFHVELDGFISLHFNRMGGKGATEVTVYRSFPPTQNNTMGSFSVDVLSQRRSFFTGVELGDYFVLVDSQGEDPQSRYEISVTTGEIPDGVYWDAESNDLATIAQLIGRWDLSVDSRERLSVEASGFGNRDGDVDWYRVQTFGIEEGASAFMNIDFVRPHGAGSTQMSVYSGLPVAESPRIGLITLQPGNNQVQNLSIPIRSGDFFLKVDNSQEIDLYSVYSLRVSVSTAFDVRWELEPNGILPFANSLTADQVLNGTSWHPDDDLDWYRFRLNKRGFLVLSYYKPFGAGSTEISLKKPNSEDIATASAGILSDGEASIGARLNTGDYFVLVKPTGEEDASAVYNLVFTALDSVELQMIFQDPLREISEVMSIGDVINLKIAWKPDNDISFDIGDLRLSLPMYDDGAHGDGDPDDGIYAGIYTVQEGDDISDAEVILHLAMPPNTANSESDPIWTTEISLDSLFTEPVRIDIDTIPPRIFRVEHDQRLRPLLAGEIVNVTMTGEPGASEAYFHIIPPDNAIIERYMEIPMQEDPEGVYKGSYTVEEGDNVNDASILAHLIDIAGNESQGYAEDPVSFDTMPPEVMAIEHDAEDTLVEGDVLTVLAVSDAINGEAAFSLGDVITDRVMYDDGTRGDAVADDGVYTGQYTVRRGDNVTDEPLSVRVTDEAGNVSEEMSFEPVSMDTSPPEITSFIHDATQVLAEDDVLTVTMNGDPGHTAVFDIEGFRVGIPMYDDGTRLDETPDDGIYVGSYTVKEGDSARDARITGYLTDKNGNQSVYRIFERVSIDAVPPEPVLGVVAIDKPDDQGFWLFLTWSVSNAEDFDHYNIYREPAPIISVRGLTPIAGTDEMELDLRGTNNIEVILPANGVDYYLAVTVVDTAGNESSIQSEPGGSVTGPIQAIDNLPPEPVTVVSATDRPDDQGKVITVSWTKSSAANDFDHYGVYLSDEPIISLEGLTPIMEVEAGDVIIITDSGSRVARYGVYVDVPSDGEDFYFAVTAFDESGNESSLDSEGRSATGPVRARDDIPPEPVLLISVSDTPEDDGGYLDVVWQPNRDEEVQYYNFYLSEEPIDNNTLRILRPVETVDASRFAEASALFYELNTPSDLVWFYVAMTAVDFEGNTSELGMAGRSVKGPVQSVSNAVAAASDSRIYAGFDPDTWVLIPAGAMRGGETVDILLPDETTQQDVEEANLFLERWHIDPYIDPVFSETVREFRSSTANVFKPATITLSYPDISEMQVSTSVGSDVISSLSQDDEENFRIFRLNVSARVPRWDFIQASQVVDTVQNTVSTQVRSFGVFRIAWLRLPENLDDLVVYPNPFIPSQSISGHITFKNLTENVDIQVYNLAGERVRTIRKLGGGDEAIWDTRNEEGEEVASGTYIFVVQGDEDTYTGKVIILR
jgi:hypothetical protein